MLAGSLLSYDENDQCNDITYISPHAVNLDYITLEAKLIVYGRLFLVANYRQKL
jgi:hypothetical protein